MGTFGADRWVSNHHWRLTHLRTKISILENENTPDGTVVRIPDEYDPSPVKEMLNACRVTLSSSSIIMISSQRRGHVSLPFHVSIKCKTSGIFSVKLSKCTSNVLCYGNTMHIYTV
jgi:hypothetical protein